MLWFVLCLGLTVQKPAVQPPPLHFESHESLQAWAEASVGGGSVYRLGPDAVGLYGADRSYTFGVYSSELGLYRHSDDGFRLVLYLPYKHFVQRKAWVEGDTLIIEERPNGQTDGSVQMRVPLQMVGDDSTPR